MLVAAEVVRPTCRPGSEPHRGISPVGIDVVGDVGTVLVEQVATDDDKAGDAGDDQAVSDVTPTGARLSGSTPSSGPRRAISCARSPSRDLPSAGARTLSPLRRLPA